jgi:hypothetical protein
MVKSAKTLEPHKQRIPQGMSENEFVRNHLDWGSALEGPNKVAAAASLLQHFGISVQDLANGQAQPPQQYSQPQYQQQYQVPAEADPAVINQMLTDFARGRPYFEHVRQTMGQILDQNPQPFTGPDGRVNTESRIAPWTRTNREASRRSEVGLSRKTGMLDLVSQLQDRAGLPKQAARTFRSRPIVGNQDKAQSTVQRRSKRLRPVL